MDERLNLVISNRIIDELGGVTAIAKELNLSTAATSQWRKFGIPSSRTMYLQLKYPKLKAWKSVKA